MKVYLKLSLTIGFSLLIVACKTAQLISKKHEGRATTTERTDTLVERDSLLLFVHEKEDTVRIIQRETKWRYHVTILHDTLLVVKTDTIIKTVEPMIRSPANPLSEAMSWLNTILAIIVIIIIITVIFKFK